MRLLSVSGFILPGVFAAFLGIAVPVGAEKVEIQVERSSDRSFTGPLEVFVIERAEGSARTARRVGSVDLGARGGYILEVAEAEGLRLAFAGDKLWGKPCTVENAACRTRIEVAEPVEVLFTRTGDEPVDAPDLLVARAWRRAAGSEDSIVCARNEGERRWSCPRPAGDVDLRFDVAGHAPAFAWQTSEPGRGAGSPIEIELERGAAIEGWIEAAEGEASLMPSGRRWEVSEARRAFAAYEADIGSDGHLRFEGVAAGTYDLSIDTVSSGKANRRVRVDRGQARLVLGAIELERSERAEILIDPPTDGWGEPWRLSLSGPKEGPEAGVVKPSIDLTGYGLVESLTPGLYHVAVRDSRDSTWYLAVHELGGEPLALSIPHVPVRGRVHAGDTPIAGTLVFGTTQGATSIRLVADEDGRFEGYLPREGTWEVEISEGPSECGTCGDLLGVGLLAPVDVEVGPSGKAILDLALPDTKISGRVFRQDGAERVPVEDAQVMGLSRDGGPGRMGRRLQLWTDEDGRFKARGIEPGTLGIGAISEKWGAESSWVQVEIRDGIETPELELRIVPKVTLPVRVTAGGTAKAGVRVHAFPEDGSSAHGTTDMDGVAELRTSQDSSGTLVIDALGYGLRLERFQVGSGTLPARTVPASPDAGDLLFEGFRAPPYEGTLHRGGAAVSLHVLRNFTPSRVQVTPEGVVLAGLAPGEYVLCGPEGSHCRAVSIPAGGVVSVPRGDWWESAR